MSSEGAIHRGILDRRFIKGEVGDVAVALSYAAVISIVGRRPSGYDGFPMPINEALAINYESTGSTAFADADQTVTIEAVGDDTGPTMPNEPKQRG
jgi:hypothetical protein